MRREDLSHPQLRVQISGGEAGPINDSEAGAGFRTMIKYEVIIYWSDEDELFATEVPELPGCAAHGATREEALGNAHAILRAEHFRVAPHPGRNRHRFSGSVTTAWLGWS
jgi:hypothetical protein